MRAGVESKFGQALLGSMLAAGFVSTAHAQAEAAPAQALLDDSFVISLGGFIMNRDVKANLNGSSSTNPQIDFNHTFGKPSDATRVRLDGLWRITPTQHVRFMYFDDNVTRSRAIEEDIHFGDTTFTAGANVEAKSKLRIAEVAYEYAFLKQSTYEVAGSIGVHYTGVQLKLSGQGTITDSSGNTSSTGFTSKQTSTPVPLPVIGIRGAWAVSDRIVLDASAQYFKAKINDYDGHLSDLRVGATWMFTKNFGVGLGYDSFRTTIDATKDSFNGTVKVGYSGAQLYVTGAF